MLTGGVRLGYYWAYKNRVALGMSYMKSRPDTPDIYDGASGAELARHLSDDLYDDVPIIKVGKDTYDMSPDLFHFSFGPYSGDFIMNCNGAVTLTSPTHPYGDFTIGIADVQGDDGRSLAFTIRTGDGYEFTFGDSIVSREKTISRVLMDECPDEGSSAGNLSDWTDNTWRLTKIKAPNGRTVTFNYKTVPTIAPTVSYSYSTHTSLVSSSSMSQSDDSVPSWQKTILNYGYSYPLSSVEITGADGTDCAVIELQWRERKSGESECQASNYANGQLVASRIKNSPMNFQEVALKSIYVFDESHNNVEYLLFNQSSIGGSGASRMILESVFSLRKGDWNFTYDNGTGVLPEYDSRMHDVWGYWNGTYIDPRHIPVMQENTDILSTFIPDLAKQRTGALIRVGYPTAGYSEISYEQNSIERALHFNDTDRPGMKTFRMNVGGIRVSGIKDYTLEKMVFARTYEYSGGETCNLHYVNFEASYIKHWGGLMQSRNKLKSEFFSNNLASVGSYDTNVGYKSVRERYPDGSFIDNCFMTYEDYGDEYFVSLWPVWKDASTSSSITDVEDIGGGSKMLPALASPQVIYGDFRGKEKSVVEYNAFGHKLRSVEYYYAPRPGIIEHRYFNMLTGWIDFDQTRFYPLLCRVLNTVYEPGTGVDSGLETSVVYAYNNYNGRKTKEFHYASDMTRTIEYVYCSDNPSLSDACSEKTAVSDIIMLVSRDCENTSYFTGKWHFGYNPSIKGIHPTSLKEYIFDIPSVSIDNARTEVVSVAYNSALRPYRITMPGDSYMIYEWNKDGIRLESRTVNGDENRTEYQWKSLVGLGKIIYPTGRSESYKYDKHYRLSNIMDSDGHEVMSYETILMTQDGYPNRITSYRYLSSDGKKYIRSSQFYDDLGYPSQTMLEKESGDGNTLVAYTEYDDMLRPDVCVPLPYSGRISIFLPVRSIEEDQRSWYLSMFNDSHPYTERSYETGISGRPLMEMKPGDEYRKAVKMITWSYSLNEDIDSVFAFRYTNPKSLDEPASALCSEYVRRGTLSRTTAVTEEGDTTQTFFDVSGKLVLERRLNGGVRYDTYRVYDLRDSLVCAIQPKGSCSLKTGMLLVFDEAFVQDNCFTWQYDGKGNLVSSHVPGAGEKHYAYDIRGRLVYSDDSSMEEAIWNGVYYSYDDTDRLVEQGMCERYHKMDYIRGALAYGLKMTELGGNLRIMRTVNYYSSDSTGIPSGLSFKALDGVVSENDVSLERCITMPSYEKLYEAPYYKYEEFSWGTPIVIDSSAEYVERAYWYDKKGRVVQRLDKTSDGWISRYSTKYDFSGNVLCAVEEHITPSGKTDVMQTYSQYDDRGHLLSYERRLNGQRFSAVEYSYDFAGRVAGKKVMRPGTSDKVSIQEEYHRDLRGWLTDLIVKPVNGYDIFSEHLYYMDVLYDAESRFDGLVSMAYSTTYDILEPVYDVYNYDHLGRIVSNWKVNNDGRCTEFGTEPEIKYDLNGNVVYLKRHSGRRVDIGPEYGMEFIHNGNRMISGRIVSPGGECLSNMRFSYYENGNMKSIAGASDIMYNVLNLRLTSKVPWKATRKLCIA